MKRLALVRPVGLLLAFVVSAQADIFQWEYIGWNYSGPGKHQSTTLAPEGAGVDAVPGADLSGRNLTMAYLIGANLTSANLHYANLRNALLYGADLTRAEVRGASFASYYDHYARQFVGGITLAQLYSTASYQAHDLTGINLYANYLAGGNFAGQNLTNADFSRARLTGADFTGAEVRGASFLRYRADGEFVGGITLAQLYSTASYQAHDMSGIRLEGYDFYFDLSGANFAGQNLTNAYFYRATLTGADLSQANLTNATFYVTALTGVDFTGAEVRGASFTGITLAQIYSTASYQAHDLIGIQLSGIDLSGANFAGQNLTNAYLAGTLTDADFTGAEVRGASFYSAITLTQLYSTASYQAKDLTGIGLEYKNLAGVNFVGQNLTNANFSYATLTDADFTGAEVRGARFDRYYDGSMFVGGITLAQLYSTTSYQAHDLSGINLDGNDLSGGNFAGQNLTGSDFSAATLTGADFTGAEVRGASFDYTGITLAQLYSTASYQEHDLTGISLQEHDLSGGNFAGQNLTSAYLHSTNFSSANLGGAKLTGANVNAATLKGADITGADFSGAHVESANFDSSNLTLAQLYSTASYASGSLSGIGLANMDLSGADFANRNLARANFSSANLSGADLTGTSLYIATLKGADITGADFSGAHVESANFDSSNLTLAQLYSTASYASGSLSGIGLANMDLSGADFANKNLNSANFSSANLSGANLTNANVSGATLSGADLTGAEVRGASFAVGNYCNGFGCSLLGGLTLGQLYSTASYQAHDLTGIRLDFNDLSGGNFTGQTLTNAAFWGATLTNADFHEANVTNANFSYAILTDADLRKAILTNATFYSATLTGADFTDAEVRGAGLSGITLAQLYSTASYQAHDLTGILLSGDLSGANFFGQKLANARLGDATLTGADFAHAEVRGAEFGWIACENDYSDYCVVGSGSGITTAQLYSTASYQAHDLSGIRLERHNLADANFARQNLQNARFGAAILDGANFREANLANAYFGPYDCYCGGVGFDSALGGGFGSGFSAGPATVNGADFTAADARGANLHPGGAITTNLIWPNGHIDGLDLDAGSLLLVRDYDGPLYKPGAFVIPITVDQHLTMASGGTLRMVFEADAWDSTISFAPGIPVTLGGTLELTFADDVNLASQIGGTLKIFDWTGVSPTGAFAISSPYAWDLSNLYTTGEVTLTAVPEPSTVGLLLLAFGLTLYRSWRRVGQPRFAPRTPQRRTLPKWRNVFITAFLVSTLYTVTVHAAAVRTVALSGQPAAGTPAGVNFSSFGAYFANSSSGIFRGPVINDAGQAAFRANLTGSGIDGTNNQGVWSEGAGSLALVARTGSAAPGAPEGVNFDFKSDLELFTPVLNNAGQTAFFGALTDGTVGLWSEGSGSLTLVARDGTPAPGTPEGVNLSLAVLRNFVFPELPLLNNHGQTAFWANVTGNGVDYTNDWGAWSEGTGSLALVARGGGPAPGTPEGVNFDSLIFQFGFNNTGQSAFTAYLTGNGVDPSNDNGVWSGGAGSLELVARSGTPAPGTPSGVNFRNFFPQPAINNLGQVAFEAFLTGEGVDAETNAEGLWSNASGMLALLARQGSPAPGTPAGVNFDWFSGSSWPLLNDAGKAAFRADLAGTGVTSTNNRGIWLGDAQGLALVARTGDQAPSTANGVRFNNFTRPSLNGASQLAFAASLTGTGVGSSNNLGIWATDESGALQLIVRTGNQLEVMPSIFRTISDLGFVADTGNSDGRPSTFNNIGQLIFWARFTDGSEGVFVSSLVAHLPGDFNNNGTVDAADYIVWRKSDGTLAGYDTWRANFGRNLFLGGGSALPSAESLSSGVPEPASILLTAGGVFALVLRSRKRAPNAIRAATHISQPHGRTVMQSHTHQNHQSAASKIRFALQVSTIVAIAIVVALPQLAASTARGGTIEFDASKKSPAVSPFDPNASFEAVNDYVSGRILREVQGAFSGGTNINTLLGADAFYAQGYTGTNAVIANIEPGHIWSDHEALTHVQQIPNNPSALNEFDRHATWVGMILGGRRGGANPGAYQEGMAPDAELYSGALATQWNGQRYTLSANLPNAIIFDQYRQAFSTGVNTAGRRADVINSSWGGTSPTTGSDTVSIALDGFANLNSHTLFVACAGNEGRGPNKVRWPAAAYNNMSVAALGSNPPYDRPAVFSSGGPSDYADPVNGMKTAARQVVDIAAPGENLSSAYYGGLTGGNGTTDNPNVSGTGPAGIPRGSLGGPDYYSRGGVNGTSFASPTVAGGAALLYDAGYSMFPTNDDARDARVIKAVLMNSADKTVGWNNGQIPHPNGDGGVLTTQGLDNRVGTGRMNLAAAYDQFLSGTTDIAGTSSGNLGTVADIGWDFGQVVSGTTNDYYIDSPLDGDSTFTATLTWFRDRRIDAANTVFDDSYDDLNLELWSVVDGLPDALISESSSLYNNSEHFSFALPVTGDYALRVRWFKELFDNVADANQEVYGLAWWAGAAPTMVAIPEPTSVVLLTMAVMAYAASQREFRRHPLGVELANRGPIGHRCRGAAVISKVLRHVYSRLNNSLRRETPQLTTVFRELCDWQCL